MPRIPGKARIQNNHCRRSLRERNANLKQNVEILELHAHSRSEWRQITFFFMNLRADINYFQNPSRRLKLRV